MASTVSRYAAYSLLVPSILVASYVLASLPIISTKLRELPGPVEPGLASLPLNSRARVVYSEDFMEGGAYVQLPMGRVRYWLIGPTSGKKIVLIHGLSVPSLAFARIAPILAAAGYRVLMYDLYGRGYSDAPQGAVYDAQLYVTQLALLLQHLHWTRTRLLGFSVGGAVAAAFVAAFPALVERDVVLLASVGAGAPPMPMPTDKFRHWPFVERWMISKVMSHITPKRDTTPMQEIVRLQAAHLRGFPRAVVATFYDGLIIKLRWAFAAPTWRGRRVLLVNGDRDTDVPPAHAHVLREMLASAGAANSNPNSSAKDVESPPPDVSLVSLPGAGHDIPWTHTDEVARAVLEFFDAVPSMVSSGPRKYKAPREDGDVGREVEVKEDDVATGGDVVPRVYSSRAAYEADAQKGDEPAES
ncbi:Alpha/Beta hydrolase protein [Mycena capillaripes]|nr:Alpha/Beta hydrolase protein [Mycena capillaripes]